MLYMIMQSTMNYKETKYGFIRRNDPVQFIYHSPVIPITTQIQIAFTVLKVLKDDLSAFPAAQQKI